MKFKKVFSIILSLSLMLSGMSVCFANDEMTRTFYAKTYYEMKNWAKDYNNNCTLSSGNDYAQCTFDSENQTIVVNKFKNGDYKVSNSTDTFASYEGNNIWLYNGSAKFYKLKDGLVEPKKLTDLLFRWGSINKDIKQKLSIPNENNIMKNENPINKGTFFHWWYLPLVGGLVWLGNLIYKNYKLINDQKNKNSQAQQQMYRYVDSNLGLYVNKQETTQPGVEMIPQENNKPQKNEENSELDTTGNQEVHFKTPDII